MIENKLVNNPFNILNYNLKFVFLLHSVEEITAIHGCSPSYYLALLPLLPPSLKLITGHSAFRYICINFSVVAVLGKCSQKKQSEM